MRNSALTSDGVEVTSDLLTTWAKSFNICARCSKPMETKLDFYGNAYSTCLCSFQLYGSKAVEYE